jgi:antitoxin component YwqK of YwqJK toxin-antitoxin module
MLKTLASVLLILCFSCSQSEKNKEEVQENNTPRTIVKRRDDGTISSVNQVDAGGIVNGMRVTYYPDGKTIYSKLTFDHGHRHGPSIWYYKNGQVFKLCTYKNGKKHGPSRKFYKNGNMQAEFDFENGNVLPGLKEYNMDGSLETDYPEVNFREIDLLASKNRIDLEISCTQERNGIRYFILEKEGESQNRTYLITEKGLASLQYYVKPGDILKKTIYILAEIPTKHGNTLAQKYSYQLIANRE